MNNVDLALAPVWYVAFLLSVTCHEAAHALAAKLGGDLTAYAAGQVSLNPLPHIRREPTGTIIIPLLSYLMSGWMMGWASAPYNPRWQDLYPKRAAWMALAGPAANFALVIVAALLMAVGVRSGVFVVSQQVGFSEIVGASSGVAEGVGVFLSIVFSLNLILGLFNLIPIPPLDGASAIGVVLPESVAAWLNRTGRNPMFSLLGIVIAWRVAGAVIWPVFGQSCRSLLGSARALRHSNW
jgi:Zn-dependent protease